MKNNNKLVDLLIEKTQECEKLKGVLKAILMNTLHRDFDGDTVYKYGVLENIRCVLGEEEYNYFVALYS